MRIAVLVMVLLASCGALFFLLTAPPRTIELQVESNISPPELPSVPEATSSPITSPSSTNGVVSSTMGVSGDIPYQTQMLNPPPFAKGVYATAWSAGSTKKMKYLVDLIGRTELNAIVIDIKDYSGFVSYRTGISQVASSGAERDIRISKPNALLKQLHEKGIYVIGRVSVFQDPVLAKAHPEWAMQNSSTGAIWKDRKGLAWMDPAEKNVWAYNVAIAKDALARGFDEINFDYVRFASDGDLTRITYPAWDGVASKHTVIRSFFEYVRTELAGQKISADLFGLATIDSTDLGIGQLIEDGYANFDFISPMIYPSHYANGFLGYKNPATVPYEIIEYSLQHALSRIRGEKVGESAASSFEMATGSTVASGTALAPIPVQPIAFSSKLRPWLQDFDIGATYDALMVRKQIQATDDVLGGERGRNFYAGWLLWSPDNVYTEDALKKE